MSGMQRMWINQPSTLQPAHSMHGINVLACPHGDLGDMVTVYFISGDTISAYIHKSALSPGWLNPTT